MSDHAPFPRVLVLVLLPLSALLGCARGVSETEPAPSASTDTLATAAGGKSIESLFQGRFPGVTVTRTDNGGLQIRIRGGNNTLMGSDEPLYVVDDTPLPAGTGGILFLNPYDIERIEVLKNPDDTAIYGIRGGNGVIRITTRRPGRR